MKTILLFNTAVAFLLCANISFAQKTYSLEECIKEAFSKSLILQQSDLGIQSNELNALQAKHNQYPSLSGFSGINLNFGRSLDPTSDAFITESFLSNNYGLNTNVLVYGGGRLKNSIKQAELEIDASKEDRSQSEADIALQVATAYLNTLFSNENIKIAEEQLKQSEEQLAFISKLVKAGVRPANELLDIEAQISTNKQSIVTAENARDLSLLQLKQLMRLSPNEVIGVITPDEINITTDPELVSFEEAYELTLRSQPSIKAAEIREESAKIGIDIAKADYYPTLSFGGSIGTAYSNRAQTFDRFDTEFVAQNIVINGMDVNVELPQTNPVFRDLSFGEQFGDNLSYGVGFNLSVPIYNRRLAKTNVERAEVGLQMTELGSNQLKESLQILVQQTLADARAAKKSYAASEVTVAARKAALDNAEKKYKAGALNSFDLTNIQTQYNNAAINNIIEKYNYLFRVKILEFYMGKSIKL